MYRKNHEVIFFQVVYIEFIFPRLDLSIYFILKRYGSNVINDQNKWFFIFVIYATLHELFHSQTGVKTYVNGISLHKYENATKITLFRFLLYRSVNQDTIFFFFIPLWALMMILEKSLSCRDATIITWGKYVAQMCYFCGNLCSEVHL